MDTRSVPRSVGLGAASLLQLSSSSSSASSSAAAAAAVAATTAAGAPPAVAIAGLVPSSPELPAGMNGNDGWANRVMTELKDLVLLLGHDGRVMYVSPSCLEITGFETKALEKSDFSRFVHEDDKTILRQELDECMETDRFIRCHFRFCKPDNSVCLLEAYGHPHLTRTTASPVDATAEGPAAAGTAAGAGLNRTKMMALCKGIFLTCRPYPTRGAQMLDSFLEHKIENIRLNQRIAQLKEEEEEEMSSRQQSGSGPGPGPSGITGIQQTTTTTTQRTYISSTTHSTFTQAMVREASVSGDENESSDTVTNTDEADADSQSIQDQDLEQGPPAEDMSHIDGIEVMTGLYYGEGERSQGLNTGVRHGRLVHYNSESSPPTDAQSTSSADVDRRKRMKGEYMCTDCGTSDSPEWRKGPEGPKSLCNACGLRWAKKEKRRHDV
ncbi:hypothetical protein BO70DRAFT_362624 [Aspergillus heteromorphus CBS 117.55]|uniref:GATA transcription factor LreB n=1 Tax=Aspergillus heteromorphus CBS 117.55 TaxID=1448321 RepID=A0A317W618_9EURO|nr:uncharacterized protein BO70DRAFT_362624 [Aspergillus heteromorphus CBS 117.55]PWY80677.1 hypothetical protein BO70DRAFT_362624 [Aspergillus heteromorphus CBS 117.55]